jgi:quinol monooxygenase YgiN
MILVTGHAIARKETEAAVERLAVEHVLRSRAEPGCVSHEVSRDVLQPLRFVFVERWSDMAALQAHFRVEASRKFAHAITELCEASPLMTIYQAEALHTG